MPDPGDSPFVGKAATAFPLMPFGGRLRDAALNWRGRRYRLPEYPPGSGQVLHGDSARRAWRLTEVTGSRLSMELDWPSATWPFDALATMTFRADAHGIHLDQRIAAKEPDAPFALGWHPFFLAGRDARLIVSASHCALLDPQGFPQPFRPVTQSGSLEVSALRATRIFRLRKPEVVLERPDAQMTVRLRLSAAFRFLTVYVPADGKSIALEPHTVSAPAMLGASEDREGTISIAVKGET